MKILLAEKLTNGTLVTPTPGLCTDPPLATHVITYVEVNFKYFKIQLTDSPPPPLDKMTAISQ